MALRERQAQTAVASSAAPPTRALDGCQGDTPMTNLFLFRWFRDVPIARKLYFTVGIMALLISVELFALFFSLSTLSSLRAYVGGEGLWSKAQKDAVFHLYKYGVSRNQEDYVLFRAFMRRLIPFSPAAQRVVVFGPAAW